VKKSRRLFRRCRQTLVTRARGVVISMADLAGGIGRAVLASLHPPRRPGVCARRVNPR
jgi:hypothetical protein